MLLRRGVVALALSIPVVLGIGTGTAAAAPQVTDLQVPVVTGFQIAPGSVPGGLFQTIPLRATVGAQPGVARFSAAVIAPFADQYPYRFLNLNWRNLATGATGTADLRHWADSPYPPEDDALPALTGERSPLDVVADTGAGPVVVTVTHVREYRFSQPYVDTLIPGVGVVLVP